MALSLTEIRRLQADMAEKNNRNSVLVKVSFGTSTELPSLKIPTVINVLDRYLSIQAQCES